MREIACVQCGKAYQGRHRQRYCSSTCSKAADEDAKYERRYYALLKALHRMSDQDIARLPYLIREKSVAEASALIHSLWDKVPPRESTDARYPTAIKE